MSRFGSDFGHSPQNGWGLPSSPRFIEPSKIVDPVADQLRQLIGPCKLDLQFVEVRDRTLVNQRGGQNLACWRGELGDAKVFIKIVPATIEMSSAIQDELIALATLDKAGDKAGAGLLGVIKGPTYVGIVMNAIDGNLLAAYSCRDDFAEVHLSDEMLTTGVASIRNLRDTVIAQGCIEAIDLQFLLDKVGHCKIIDASGRANWSSELVHPNSESELERTGTPQLGISLNSQCLKQPLLCFPR